MTKSIIHGVEIPKSLLGDAERANAFVAGYSLYKQRKVERVPEELRPLCNQYGTDITRSGLMYPQVTRVESSFWAGYLTAESSSRDKVRANSKETEPRDLTNELRRGTRSLEGELTELFHKDDE